MDELRRRVRRLERLNLALAAGLALAGLMAASRGVPDQVRARNFIVEDSRGSVRATFGVGRDRVETPNLQLIGRDEKPRINATVTGDDTAAIRVWGAGKGFATMESFKEGPPAVAIYDEKGDPVFERP